MNQECHGDADLIFSRVLFRQAKSPWCTLSSPLGSVGLMGYIISEYFLEISFFSEHQQYQHHKQFLLSSQIYSSTIIMHFYKIFVFVALILAISMGQSQAGWLKKIGKKIERVGQHTRDATIQGLGVAQQAANVAATARG